MIVNRQAAIITAVLVALMFAGALWVLPLLPEGARVPLHYGIDGTPDRWASAPIGLFFFPAMTALIWALFAVLPFIDKNLQRSQQAYGVIWVGMTALFAAIQSFTVVHALGGDFNMARAIPMLIGVLFITMGNVMGKVRRNFFMGIRTRWTLADEEIWDKTHRFGGWVFVAGGFTLIFVALALADHHISIVALIGVIVAVTLLPVLKSYLLWRNRNAA